MTVLASSIQADWKAFCSDPCERTFEPFYAKTRALVWTICLRILRNEEDAADAMQTTYCRLLKLARRPDRADVVDEHGGPRQVVYRMAVREANNLRMRRYRRARKEVAVERVPNDCAVAAIAGEQAEQVLLREAIEQIVERLPDRYRVPILLHYFDGLSHREVAAAIGAPVSTVSNRIARAHRKLEPMLRRAGLGGASLVLATIGAHAALIEPPAILTGRSVFRRALVAAAAGTAGSLLPSWPAVVTGGKALSGLMALLGLGAGVLMWNVVQSHAGATAQAAPTQAVHATIDGQPAAPVNWDMSNPQGTCTM